MDEFVGSVYFLQQGHKIIPPYKLSILAQFSFQIEHIYATLKVYTTLLLVHNNFQVDCINHWYIMIYQIWVIV